MANVTAAMVKELREKTGAGMMDCKGALNETAGDLEAAVDWLRKKGLAKAAKKAGRVAADRDRSVAEGPGAGRADPGRRLRRLRHRPAHPQGALAEALALAVHPRPRDRRRDRREGLGVHLRLHGEAARRRLQGDDPAAHAVRTLLLLRPLPGTGQQMPDAGLLRALSRLRQGAASLGWLGRIRLRRPRDAARHEGLQAARRHVPASRRAVRAADLLHPCLQPRDEGRGLQVGRYGRDPGVASAPRRSPASNSPAASAPRRPWTSRR